jgi:hypothetical protein
MPNPYRYFESGEIAFERVLLEVELLRALQQQDRLNDLDWHCYDTTALNIFAQAGIEQASVALAHRQARYDVHRSQLFVKQCLQRYEPSASTNYQCDDRVSSPIIVNTAFGLLGVVFIFIWTIVELVRSSNDPTSRRAVRRYGSLDTDLFIVVVTGVSALLLLCYLIALRWTRHVLLSGFLVLLIVSIVHCIRRVTSDI